MWDVLIAVLADTAQHCLWIVQTARQANTQGRALRNASIVRTARTALAEQALVPSVKLGLTNTNWDHRPASLAPPASTLEPQDH